MLAIVRLALRRPYTFVVMAILIEIYGTLAAIRTPVNIFPNIGIPVVSVIWSFTGLPADDMSGRIVYYYERSLTTTVNDIEHIESQSVTGSSAPRKSGSSNIQSISTILRNGSRNSTICPSRSSTAPWSICAMLPMCTTALRRKPTSFNSKARRACS